MENYHGPWFLTVSPFNLSADDFTDEEEVQSFGYKRFGE